MATPTITVTVTVTSDENNSQILTVDHQEITLEHPNDWVLWTLEDRPPGFRLAILFEPPVGPFQTVQSTSASNLVGKGNKGGEKISSATYRLYLIPENAKDLTSQPLVHGGPFTVFNASPKPNPTPWLKATFTEGDTGKIVEFDSNTLLLFDGDLVFWEIEGLTDDHIVAFPISEFSHSTGPFPTSLATRTPQTVDKRLGVARFQSSEVGTLSFSVQVWDKNGNPVPVTGDPTIDGLGRPPE